MKKVFLMMTLVICVLGVSAQNTKVITGAVIDNNGNALSNALVEATGGAENVTTDADGSYRIEVSLWLKSLTAKYAGFRSKKIKLKHNNQVLFRMEPKTDSWFIDAAYSINFGEVDFSRVGLMGGYLGKWGGYAKVLFMVGTEEHDGMPSVTAGVIKQVTKPLYLYLGTGYSPVLDYYYYEELSAGAIFEAGAIFKFSKVNFSLGYAFNSSFSCLDNHSVQVSLGYCF